MVEGGEEGEEDDVVVGELSCEAGWGDFSGCCWESGWGRGGEACEEKRRRDRKTTSVNSRQ